MKKIFILLILSYLQLIINFNVEDFVIEEVKRTINLKLSIISIENKIKLKRANYEDTFRYLVPKNNTYSLVRMTAQTNSNKKLEFQKVSDDKDYDYYDIVLQGSSELTVKEDYFEK